MNNMIEQEQTLTTWLRKMVNRFPWLRAKFEYSKSMGGFLVSFSPSNIIEDSEDFCHEALKFEDEMIELYGDDYAPLFCDEEECFTLSENAQTISNSNSNFQDQGVSLWKSLVGMECVGKEFALAG